MEYYTDLEYRTYSLVDELLAEIPEKPLRKRVSSMAFTPNEFLPKRSKRPKIEIPFLVEQIFLSYTTDEEDLDTLLQFSVLIGEYYDIYDDILDDDVATARREVIATWQVMFPLALRLLCRLGDDAVSYWTHRAMCLPEGQIAEAGLDPSGSLYYDIVHQQSVLFGFLAGLGAVVAGAEQNEIRNAECLGGLFFKYEQFILDAEQYRTREATDTGEIWNAMRFMSDDELIAQLRSWQSDANQLLKTYPAERAALLESLFSVDLDEWWSKEC
ncbi:hypothetical protein [Natranaeroarchaeum aerophilus]|uniref:Uncharacterized protein n=1 Tax=Natranaeroarchaeum aerophilus TaxID=2917711 RepID=A0AAE3FNQ5_9EURY|nr:hypothetical protein [Natranaeroarchaeum aerophilus]MCL9812295.1 hypothetical protein [Natranaeroarchaeum aerophilus]